MRFGSVCSGIEAASVAWHPLGWRAAWLAEIEPFPSAVLAHHYPEVPNLGDMTTIARRVLAGEIEAPDVLTGGTPCQAFSVAGMREGLADERGQLTLKFVELANAIDHVRGLAGLPPCIIVWENVPGVLSSKDNAFGCFLAGLAGEDDQLQPPGRRWENAGGVYGPARAIAWRTLDAQYFGLAQRRRRVFVVASSRNGFDPAAVLFEWQGLRRDSAPSRQAGKVAPTIPAHSTDGGGLGTDFDLDGGLIAHRWPAELASTLDTSFGPKQGLDDQHVNAGCPLFVPACASAESGLIAFDSTQITSPGNRSNPRPGDPCHPLAASAHPPAIAFPANLSGTQCASTEDLAPSLGAKNPTGVAYTTKLHNTGSNNAGKIFEERTTCLDANSPPPVLLMSSQVRRLTPEECEALQGFPRSYTRISWGSKPAAECPDGHRYKALGNSWAVPVARWIGHRIQLITNPP